MGLFKKNILLWILVTVFCTASMATGCLHPPTSLNGYEHVIIDNPRYSFEKVYRHKSIYKGLRRPEISVRKRKPKEEAKKVKKVEKKWKKREKGERK